MLKNVYEVSKKFTMKAEITERTLAVSEAFGISLDDEFTFTIYDGFRVNILQGDVVYIIGDSGSGKSLLLKELRQQMPNAISTSEFNIDHNSVIIEGVGKTMDEAIYYLTLAGLNDAFIFLRKYGELSDGQKYRFHLAKLLESNADAYFIDEFCALLDRETAKVVAFNMQKMARKFNKTLVVATTHSDLIDDLAPSVYIRKGLENDVTVKYDEVPLADDCSVVKKLLLEEGTLDDFRVLSRFHYRSHKVAAPQKIFKYTLGDDMAGVIVYTYPYLALAGRNRFTDRYKAATSEVAKLLNNEVALIARVVLHPKYRGIGLGAKLIKDTMHLTGKRYIEMLTTMGKFNPFGEKAGMTKVEYETKDRFTKLRQKLTVLGWNLVFANSRQYNLEKLSLLDEETYEQLATEIVKKVRQGKDGGVQGANRNKKKASERSFSDYTMEEVAKMMKDLLPKERAYYIWENPEWRATPE